MLKFSGRDFFFDVYHATSLTLLSPSLSASGIKVMVDQLQKVREQCSDLGLTVSVANFDRTLKQIGYMREGDGAALTEIARLVQASFVTIHDELNSYEFLALAPADARYWSDSLFNSATVEYFSEAKFDMTEAGKCLALERSTACVFHLMRVLEYGLQEISCVLGMTDPRPNWDPVIRKIDFELKAKYEDRVFKGATDFLANVSAHLQAVKVAWRNRAMHIEKKHTMEEAREIYNATRAFMRYLAENLPNAKGVANGA